MRRAVSFSADIITEPPPQQRNEAPPRDRAAEAAEAALARQPALVRSLSLDVIDSSHIDPIEFGRRRDYLLEKRARGELEGGEEDLSKNKALMVVPTPDDDEEEDGFEGGASPKKPARADNSYSAEEIALRRFMTAVAWGPGMAVLKHNRRKGRVRRLLKFNDQVRTTKQLPKIYNIIQKRYASDGSLFFRFFRIRFSRGLYSGVYTYMSGVCC